MGARSVLHRFSEGWLSAATGRDLSVMETAFPRRVCGLQPVRWCHGAFTLDGRRVRLPVAEGGDPLWVRLDRDVPYSAEQLRSVALLDLAGRLFLEITADVPVEIHPDD